VQLDEKNRLQRTRLDGCLFAWSYSFPSPSPVVPLLALGIEIGVVLRGERSLEWADGTKSTIVPGAISVVDLGDAYTTRFIPPQVGAGREIGFVLRLDRDESWRDRDAIPTFPRRAPIVDRDLRDLAEECARGFDDRRIDADAVAREVRAFVNRHALLVPVDPLLRARLELHRHFAKPLYMRHFAEMAGVHPATFARKFAARFGVTPTRYRTLLRLQEAGVLLATRSDMTVGEVAARVGFEDVPYFHRAFAARVGATPLALARQFSAGAPGGRPQRGAPLDDAGAHRRTSSQTTLRAHVMVPESSTG
jgi:AraC-like DNA-binding protein